MIKKPLIGLTAANIPTPDWGDGRFKLDRDGQLRLYGEAVAMAGGLPLVLPLIRTPMDISEDDFSACGPGNLYDNARIYMDSLDGLILSGGGDLGPAQGAAKAEHYRLVDRSRDHWEAALLAAALEKDKPVLGICRGVQVMNSALGGTLWTDLPEERPGPVEHEQKLPRARATHRVVVEAGTKLAGCLMGFSEVMVNSGHHQAIKELAPSLIASAKSDDGLIEAAEHREARWVIGVQWHPEGMLAAESSRALFAHFIDAAAAGAR